MGAIVNLRRERKRRARDRAAEQAAEARARHGLTRAERDALTRERQQARTGLDGAQLEPPDGDAL